MEGPCQVKLKHIRLGAGSSSEVGNEHQLHESLILVYMWHRTIDTTKLPLGKSRNRYATQFEIIHQELCMHFSMTSCGIHDST